MARRRDLVFLLVLATLLFSPCRRPPGLKGLSLTASFSDRVLTDNLFTDVTFHFWASPSFAGLHGSTEVFAELRRGGRRLAGLSFAPDVPTEDWKPGQEYVFTRRFYIPFFINEFSPDFRGYEAVEFRAGLEPAEAAGKPTPAGKEAPPSSPSSSPSSSPGLSRPLDLFSRRLRVLPAPAFPAIVYLGGWYPPVPDPERPGRTVRWTSSEASCIIDNPGHDGLLVIRGVRGRSTPPGQTVTVAIDGREIGRFIPSNGRFEWSREVPEARLEGRDDFILTVSVDKTFVLPSGSQGAGDVPASLAGRELGVGVTLLYFR